MLEKIIFKVTGDLVYDRKVLDEIKEAVEGNESDLIYGFGTLFSEELKKNGIPYKYIDGIRQTTPEGMEIALKISEKIKEDLEKEFSGCNISLISPVKKVNGEVINTNSDEILIKEGGNYDRIIVYTLEGRDKNKIIERLGDKVEIRYRK